MLRLFLEYSKKFQNYCYSKIVSIAETINLFVKQNNSKFILDQMVLIS